jgi:hypothetical protein
MRAMLKNCPLVGGRNVKLQGNIQIGMAIGGHGPDFVRIQVEDEKSRCCVIEINLTLEAWAKALANRNQDCEFTLYGSPNLGKRFEHKTVLIADPDPSDYMKKLDAKLSKAIKAFEKDGWTGDIKDFRNHHNYDGKTKKYAIRFVRWVEEAGT